MTNQKVKNVIEKWFVLVGFAFLIFSPGCNSANESLPGSRVREPAVAGSFYSSHPGKLKKNVDELLAAEKPIDNPSRLLGLVVPHASYYYSGKSAAAAFRQLSGRPLEVIYLIGCAHKVGFPAISIPEVSSYRTPLGLVEVDEQEAGRLRQISAEIISLPVAHEGEHSLEVQLPFLQVAAPGARIVPILVGSPRPETLQALSLFLGEALIRNPRSAIICSTDLVHYPSRDLAQRVDPLTLEAIAALDPDAVVDHCQNWMKSKQPNLVCVMCAREAVLVTMKAVARAGARRGIVLACSNSADVAPGREDRVVGYGAVAFFASGKNQKIKKESEKMAATQTIPDDARKLLLGEARQALTEVVNNRALPSEPLDHQGLQGHQGAFVTLSQAGRLRGCIGRFTADEPVYRVVRQMAEQAGLHDPRFSPVQPSELDDISIEISVLSPLHRVTDPLREVELGTHGIYIRKGWRTGTYLPQVATEHDMSLEEFLSSCCAHKAGLAPDAWKDPTTEVFVYSAEVFSE